MNYYIQNSNSDDIEYIFTPYVTKKDGTKIYAADYGIKAFRIRIRK